MSTARLQFEPVSELEKFGQKIHDLLVENFPQTFFVGGMVRDMLLRKTITDIDIATAAEPKFVVKALQQSGVKYDENNVKFGVVSAIAGNSVIEIATFRQDIYKDKRYPKVKFIQSPEEDSKRRDFTVNSLYFKPKNGDVLDFCGAYEDIQARIIRFIGNPAARIQEDPLRIVRALRFCAVLDMTLEKQTKASIKTHFALINKLSPSRMAHELEKIKNQARKKTVLRVLDDSRTLDNIF